MGDYADMETDRSMNDWIDDGCPRTEVRPSTAKRKRRTMTQQTKTTAIAEYNQTEAGLAKLKEMYGATVWKVENAKQMAAAKKARAEIKRWRLDLESLRKDIKSPALQRCKAIDTEAARIKAELLLLEQPVDEAIKEVEQKEKREAEEKARVKAEHQAKCLAEIDRIRNVPVDMVGKDLDALQLASDDLGALDLSWLTESVDVARITRTDAMAKLEDMRAAAESQAKEQARITADRAEFDRLRAEQEARAKAEREEREIEEKGRAKAEAEARAKQAAEDRARREKIEADEKAARDRIAEEERISREAREKREADARERREAEEAELQKERDRIAEQERAARLKREKADTEARELRAKQEADEREARELEEARLREERDRLEDERKAERIRIEAQEKAKREKAEAEERELQRQRDELLDGRALLETFVDRFGEIAEFASVANSIRSYLDR